MTIAETSFLEHSDAFLKCLDYVDFFHKHKKIDLSNFISKVVIDELHKQKLVHFLEYILKAHPDMTIRKIKLILRQANIHYVNLKNAGYEPNWLICIAINAAKYIHTNATPNNSYYDNFIKNNHINAGNEFNRLILITAAHTSNSLFYIANEQLGQTMDIILVKRDRPDNQKNYPSTPYLAEDFTGKNNMHLPDFYFS